MQFSEFWFFFLKAILFIFNGKAAYDRVLVNEVRNHLMEVNGLDGSGVDLGALNIQRGRDHGIQGYVAYETFCSKDILKRLNKHDLYVGITKFEDLAFRGFDKNTIDKLQSVYNNVADVDLFVGGLSEPSLPDAVISMSKSIKI